MKRIDSFNGLFLPLAEWEFLDRLQDLGYVLEATAYRSDRSFAVIDGEVNGYWIFNVESDLRSGPPLRVELGEEGSLVEFTILCEFVSAPISASPTTSCTASFYADCDADRQQRELDAAEAEQRYWNEFVEAELRFDEMVRDSYAALGVEIDAEFCGSDYYDLDNRLEVTQLRSAA